MTTPTELYVDPSIAADSGAGTIGDPYGDLEYCIEQETFDLTNGTRINGLRAAEHPVVPGDRIELGDVVVELVED